MNLGLRNPSPVLLQIRRGYYISEPSGDKRCIPHDGLSIGSPRSFQLREPEAVKPIWAEYETEEHEVPGIALTLNRVPHEVRTREKIAGQNNGIHVRVLRMERRQTAAEVIRQQVHPLYPLKQLLGLFEFLELPAFGFQFLLSFGDLGFQLFSLLQDHFNGCLLLPRFAAVGLGRSRFRFVLWRWHRSAPV